MKVRDLIQRLVELDRQDAEVGLMVFDRSGAVTILAALEAERFDERGEVIGLEEGEPTAVLIIGGRPTRPHFVLENAPMAARGCRS